MDLTPLKRFGLNDKEISVYLALLRGGTLTGGAVASKTHLHRRTAYDILDALMEKGLVTHSIRERRRFFQATPPKNFLGIIKEQEESIKGILPELETLQREATNSANAEVFMGIKSVKKIFEDILNFKEYCVLGAGEPLTDLLGPFFLLFQKRKREMGIHSRIIIAKKFIHKDVATKSFGEVRYLNEFESPTTTYVFGNKVAIILSDPAMGILITSEKVSESFRNYFHLLWNTAAKAQAHQ